MCLSAVDRKLERDLCKLFKRKEEISRETWVIDRNTDGYIKLRIRRSNFPTQVSKVVKCNSNLGDI